MLRHQQALHREIFVQVGPVDAQARANQAPVLSLRFGGALQSREPSQWDQQRAAVIQFHGQVSSVMSRLTALEPFPGLSGQAAGYTRGYNTMC